MARKNQKSALGYICLALVAICAIVAIVGVTQNWTVFDFGGEEVTGSTLKDYIGEDISWDKVFDSGSTSTTMAALGYLAAAAVCVVLVAYILKQLFTNGLFRVIVILLGVVTMAAGVAAIAYAASQTSGLSTSTSDLGGILGSMVEGFENLVGGSTGVNLGIGCYLTSIGAIGGGLFAVVGSIKR